MSGENNPKKYAVDTMVEVAKQLITLASGFIVLSVSLLDVMVPDSSSGPKCFFLMMGAWVLLLFSILSGLLALGAVASTAQEKQLYNVDDPTTRSCLCAQQVLFVLAFVLFVIFAGLNHGS